MASAAGLDFLPGVPIQHVLSRLNRAGGNEIGSGKLASPNSSAALAVNTFGWFIERSELLPAFPAFHADWPPIGVEVEYCARFPWRGGKHPWLDAMVETATAIIGVESKRYEPYRDRKRVKLSSAYDRPVWGDEMHGYERMRDQLRRGDIGFVQLDATQLVKHAFGLITESQRRRKRPILLYLFAEPPSVATKAGELFRRHRDEITRFGTEVAGSAVAFAACSYREWLATWADSVPEVQDHGRAVATAFQP